MRQLPAKIAVFEIVPVDDLPPDGAIRSRKVRSTAMNKLIVLLASVAMLTSSGSLFAQSKPGTQDGAQDGAKEQERSPRRERSGRRGSRQKETSQETFACADGYQLNYRMSVPKEPVAGETYPLIVCLHGAGGSTQAPRALAQADVPPCFVLAPSVPVKTFSWAGKRKHGLPYVFEAIDAFVERHPIDPERIYVTGQSMGGQGTWGAVAMRPTFFAAAVPVCGGWKTSDAAQIKDVPIWVFHGAEDKTVPVRYSREMVEALRAVGGAPKYTEYPSVGHNAWTQAYNTDALWAWVFAQRRTSEPEVLEGTSPTTGE